MRQAGRAADAGFTLLEIIVALVVLGVLLVTLSQGVHFGFTAWGRQDSALRVSEALQATDRTLRRLVVQLDPGTPRDAGKLVGRPHAMAFTAPLPIGRNGGMEQADISLMVDHDGQLILSWLPHLHVARLSSSPAPDVVVLLRHVATLQLSYWSNGNAKWSRSWSEYALPDLVRIRIDFPEGDGRHWPDIVAAPVREQPPS